MIIEYGGKVLYEAQPRQELFHSSPAQCRMYGGAAGGGKTEAILWEIFDICNDPRYRRLNGAVFRKTYPEVEEYFINRALNRFPIELYRYDKAKHVMTFTRTGSRVSFRYCESDIDVIRHQGAQWDFLAIDEFTHHTEYVFKYLFTRLRTETKNWKPLFFGGTNPGGVGHNWVKRIWIDKDLTPVEKKFTWDFIPARLDDNPRMLENNPSYEDQLMMIPDEMIKKALRWGDWNVFAGQFFSEIRQDVHAFEPFEMPKEWLKFLMIDYGWDHPTAVYWAACDEDGEVWIYKELICRERTYSQVGELIVEMTGEDEKIDYGAADPSIWAKKGNAQGLSGAEELQTKLDQRKIVLFPADNDRINGWGIMREWLKVFKKEGQDHSRLHISNALNRWWKMVPSVQRDPKKPEDVLKQDDDEADSVRYGLMSRPRPTQRRVKDKEVDRYGSPIKRPVRRSFGRQGRPKSVQPEWTPAVKPEYYGRR